MKVIIYRNKETNKIVSYDEMRQGVTQENVDKYNANPNYDKYVEIVDLQEDSIAYYFYNLKIQRKIEYYNDLRNLEDTLRDIASNIDDRLSEIKELCKEQQNER
jgi:hypothetical protein